MCHLNTARCDVIGTSFCCFSIQLAKDRERFEASKFSMSALVAPNVACSRKRATLSDLVKFNSFLSMVVNA
jgi:hypothetical protein